MRARTLAIAFASLSLLVAACGGSPRATTADLAALHQPTPDPTLDAVVRNLPRALAGTPPTPTPTPPPPAPKRVAAPAAVPSHPPTATPVRARR